MKNSFWMFTALVACVATRAQADGVCYDPDHTSKNEATVRADMAAIKAKGFSHIRTYICKFGNTDMAAIVASSGLRVALGIPYPDGDYQQHVTNAVNAAKKYGTVDYIFVGNENLGSNSGATYDMANVIRSIKSQVPGVKVGTVQRTVDYLNNYPGMADLVSASDAVGVNIHPFFTANQQVETAITNTGNQWTRVVNSGLPNIGSKLILTETGWPSSGSYAGSQGSLSGAQSYFGAYKSWASFLSDDKKFYFQYYDTPYKGVEYERTYGLVSADGSAKFNAGGNPTSAPTPAPTPAPTTPAPTTPAPTTPAPTTVAPSANATSSTASSSSSDLDDLVKGSGSDDKDSATISSTDSSSVADTESTAENEAGVIDTTNTATTDDSTTTGTDGTQATGDKEDVVEANTQSASGGSVAGIVVVAFFGVAAVGAAFAFIWKARQKAAELEENERKSFDSFAITPGGGCAL